MAWVSALWSGEGVAHDILILSLVAFCGLILGNVKVRGIGLGIAGVLFAGIAFAHYGVAISPETLHFVRDFGLILFVYGIGLQVGPSFWSSLRRHGLLMNALATGIVALGAAVTLMVVYFGNVPIAVAAGLFAGATTNTPSLAAAQTALSALPGGVETARLPGLGYAIAYPFGVFGIILTMLLMRAIFRVDVEAEVRTLDAAQKEETPPLETRSIEVHNANLEGVQLENVPLLDSSVVVSRISRGDLVEVAAPSSVLHHGDVLLCVGRSEHLNELQIVVGTQAEVDVKTLRSGIVTRRVLVTDAAATGKRLRDLRLWNEPDITITRVRRLELEFTATPQFRLQHGDSLLLVGLPEAIERAARFFGDDTGSYEQPQLLPIFVGIALGILVGHVPLPIPGIANSVTVGLAGGPLLVALVLSRLGRVGPLVFHLPKGANIMMRELGIVLFLACAGLKSGATFVETLLSGSGFAWLAYGALITLVPLIVVAVMARVLFKMPFPTLCGLLAGSTTDPPALAFATTMNNTPAVSLSYATVYPLVMLMRVVVAQLIVVIWS